MPKTEQENDMKIKLIPTIPAHIWNMSFSHIFIPMKTRNPGKGLLTFWTCNSKIDSDASGNQVTLSLLLSSLPHFIQEN